MSEQPTTNERPMNKQQAIDTNNQQRQTVNKQRTTTTSNQQRITTTDTPTEPQNAKQSD